MRLSKHEVEEEIRKTGIDVIGDAHWGTHFCQFYQTKEDLVDVLVPYFKAGLENNEFCMWVTSEPLSEEEAEKAMRKAVPSFDRYVERGQIEIVPHTQWYLKGGAFNLQRVLNAWIDKLNQALAKGYDGVRVTGNTAWLEKRDWRSFADYEEEVNDVIGKYRMIAICTYPLDKCGASEVIDVVHNHQFALVRRRGEWELVESSELKRAKEALRDSVKEYRNLVDNALVGVYKTNLKGDILYVNTALARMLEFESPEEMMLEGVLHRYKNRKDREVLIENLKKNGKVENFEVEALTKTGRPKNLLLSAFLDGDIMSGMIMDITERKKVEEQLRASEKRFRNTLDNMLEGCQIIGYDWRYLYVNDAVARHGRTTKERLLGKTMMEMYPGIEKTEMFSTLRRCMEERISAHMENEFEFPDGEKGWFELSIQPVPEGIFILSIDITERKKAELALKESEERYRSLLELAPDGIVTADMRGVITSVNNVFLRLTGYTKEEIVGKHFTKLQTLRAKDIPRYIKFMTSALRGKLPPPFEYSYVRKDGTVGWGEAHVGSLKKGGKKIGFQVILREISERKRAELASKLSEQKYKNIFENARDAIVTFDLKGNVTAVNKAAEEYGFKKDEMIGKSMLKFVSKKYWPRLLKELAKIARGKKVEGEIELITPKGKKIAEYRSNPIRRGKKVVGLQTILRDITERKKAEELLKQSEEKFRNIFENANDCLIYLDSSGRILDVNRKAVEVFGGSKEKLLGKHFAKVSIFSREDIPALESTFANIMAGKEDTVNICIKNKKGREMHLECSASLIKTDDKLAGMMVIARDVTERKKAEKALKESEQKLRGIIGTSPNAIVWVDTTGRITLVNRKVFELTGFSEKDLVGKSFMDVEALTQESKEKILEAFLKRLEGIDTPPYEVEIVAKNGEVIPAELSASPIYEGDKIVGTQSILRDLRERKHMEEKLRESEERFRNLFESIQDPVGVFVGREGRLIEYNTAFKKLSGYNDEELKDKTFLDFVHPDDQAIVLENYRTKYLEEELLLIYEIKAVNKKGEIIPLEISVSTYKVKGKVVGIEVIHRDITERKKMEEQLKEYTEHLEEKVKERTKELRESEERYSSIVNDAIDSLESGIFLLDKNFKVVWINKAVEKFFGVNKHNLIGEDKRKAIKEKIKYAFEDPERFEKTVLATYDNNTYIENFECHITPTENREERFLVHWSIPIKTGAYAGGRIEHYYDITKLKQMEQQLLKSERLATIGELATMVGHDLRNPLQAIENATYYLNNKLPRLPPSTPIPQKAMEMLQVINDSVNYADKIIKDLQDFSATKKPTPKKTNINAIVKETLSQVEAPENVELITELGHLPEIKVDKDMIKRVFLNLTINGIQAMENGGTLKVSTKKTKEFVEVSFEDTGIGISKGDMKKIFTPFFTRKAKGIGMGLAICKKFVDAHGGNIEVESEEGKGTTFTVKLPIQ